MSKTQRFCERSLPPYRFDKHKSPHPTQHPDGHFRDKVTLTCPDLASSCWRECEGYLYALDLFNHGYFWACHEILEDLWHAVDHATPVGHFIQGFIQCTITHWHATAGRKREAENILQRIPRHMEATQGLSLCVKLSRIYESAKRLVDDPIAVPSVLEPDSD